MELREGSLVTLKPDATYYDGKEIPGWVKTERWYIKSISGDRVVLGKNESGSCDISNPVNVAYIIQAGQAQSVQTTQAKQQENEPDQAVESPQSTHPISAASQREMFISSKGVELIAKYEGCRLEAYKCPAGVWTIGYGHTEGVQPGQKLQSKEAAMNLLHEDLKRYVSSVNNYVKKGTISFPLNQNQFDALTSFCYSCGPYNLQKLVSRRNVAEVAEKIMGYTHGGGKELPGLVRRRGEERALFLS